MKWVAIAGSWRKTNKQVEDDVRTAVRDLVAYSSGLVSGGALGVDFFATDEALKDPNNKNIKIHIPSTLEIYVAHLQMRGDESPEIGERVAPLIEQLKEVQRRGCLIEGTDTVLNQETYFKRITKIIEDADELIAFQVNKSLGTQDTIDKAKNKGMPIEIFSYEIN